MPFTSVVLLIFAILLAAAVSYYLYFFRNTRHSKINPILAVLRFTAILGVLLLLIDLKYDRTTYEVEPTDLLILADNSSSISSEEDRNSIENFFAQLKDDEELENRFQFREFSFGPELHPLDSLTYEDQSTNIANALKRIGQLYPDNTGAVVLLSDGIQTLGEDYSFYGNADYKPIFPLVLGDTTRYEDLRIDRVNLNNYAFLGNKFPVEVLLSYQGGNEVTSTLNITVDGVSRYRRGLAFNAGENTRQISIDLEARSVGLKQLTISLTSIEGERNTSNNLRTLGLEVVDEQTRIALVSDIIHPDLRLFKESIESNEQRSVSVVKPADAGDLSDFDLFILYQPNARFKNVLDYIQQRGSPNIIVAGPKTDWQFLNRSQNNFSGNRLGTVEEVVPILNSSFGLFDLGNFGVDGYPPLNVDLGDFMLTKPHEILLEQRIKGIDVDEPLMALIDDGEVRQALILGEHLWKWRIQEYRNSQSFEAFDNFMGKVIRYLSATQSKDRLTVDYDKNLLGSTGAVITARYFDEAFQFNGNATLKLFLKNSGETGTREMPMLLQNEFYEADISSLPAGDYTFTVAVEGTDIKRQGSFKVLAYDIEQQLVSSDYQKLDFLAEQSGGRLYFKDSAELLLRNLKENPRFAPLRKSTQNVVSLIDFKILLGIIAAALAAEWFIRKYHGLI